jgi:Flp pilus assembly protein TadD
VPEHTEAPGADEKVPAAHWEQLEAPADEKVPAAHGAHVKRDAAPTAVEKLPAGHSRHDVACVASTTIGMLIGARVAQALGVAAASILARAIALDPANPDAHNNLGNAFLTLGQHDEAVSAYRRCLELAPDHPQATANLQTLGRGHR